MLEDLLDNILVLYYADYLHGSRALRAGEGVHLINLLYQSDDNGAVNRLLLAARNLPDLCGLRIDAVHLAWSGGHSYLHRNVPLYHQGQPAVETGYFNYAIVRDAMIQAVVREGPFALVKTGFGPCIPDTRYSWKLP